MCTFYIVDFFFGYIAFICADGLVMVVLILIVLGSMCKHQLNDQNVYLAWDEKVLSVNVVVLVYYIMLSYLLSELGILHVSSFSCC